MSANISSVNRATGCSNSSVNPATWSTASYMNIAAATPTLHVTSNTCSDNATNVYIASKFFPISRAIWLQWNALSSIMNNIIHNSLTCLLKVPSCQQYGMFHSHLKQHFDCSRQRVIFQRPNLYHFVLSQRLHRSTPRHCHRNLRPVASACNTLALNARELNIYAIVSCTTLNSYCLVWKLNHLHFMCHCNPWCFLFFGNRSRLRTCDDTRLKPNRSCVPMYRLGCSNGLKGDNGWLPSPVTYPHRTGIINLSS